MACEVFAIHSFAKPFLHHKRGDFRLLTPALSSFEEEREIVCGTPGSGFKIRSRRGDEAEDPGFARPSASLCRRLRPERNFETASMQGVTRRLACLGLSSVGLFQPS